MNTAAQVDQMVKDWKAQGLSKGEIVQKIAGACVGWSYIFGAAGCYCNVANRKSYADRSSCPSGEADQIRKKCQQLNGSAGSCSGCKYFPGAVTRAYDCRGFTRWVLNQVGVSIMGGGATSQWNDDGNWKAKGEIAQMPRDIVCCVFMHNSKTGKMDHTGLFVGGETIIHCSGEVKVGKVGDRGWTHFAIPNGMEGDVPVPTTKPTLRKGATGPYVVECQEDLLQLGYDLSPYGADGKYGDTTIREVKKFQKASGLTADGICGAMTWAALDAAVGPEPPVTTLYTVHIPHQSESDADALIAEHPGAWKTGE